MKKYAFHLCIDPKEHDFFNCLACQKRALVICFVINFAMFVGELVYGILSNSASLLGDSAHNIGDAFILGSSIFIISASHLIKAKLALIKAIIMFTFGLLPLYQIYSNLSTAITPDYLPIICLGSFALIGNLISTSLLLSYSNKDVNFKSAYVCVRNDALGNLLVIIAGSIVMVTGSHWPDAIAGLLISALILYSSTQIAKESLSIIKQK